MLNWVQEALNLVDTGIIVLDRQYVIKFWNKRLEKLSHISHEEVIGKAIFDVCKKFNSKQYKDILDSVLLKGQSRFCSSALHKAFIYSPDIENTEIIRQNMNVEPIENDGNIEYILLQITDITDSIQNEQKLKGLIDELKKDYDYVKESELLNLELAKYDSLTGLFNRFLIETELDKLIKIYGAQNKMFALMFIDLDGFKLVNDTYGHVVGDILLQQVAGRFKNNVKDHGLVARIGGDEFLIILTQDDDVEEIKVAAQNLIEVVRKPYVIDNEKILISASIGIAIYPKHSSTVKGLINKADIAMYKAKQEGKNAFRLFETKL